MGRITLTGRMFIQVSTGMGNMAIYCGEPGDTPELPDDVAKLAVSLGLGRLDTGPTAAEPAPAKPKSKK